MTVSQCGCHQNNESHCPRGDMGGHGVWSRWVHTAEHSNMQWSRNVTLAWLRQKWYESNCWIPSPPGYYCTCEGVVVHLPNGCYLAPLVQQFSPLMHCFHKHVPIDQTLSTAPQRTLVHSLILISNNYICVFWNCINHQFVDGFNRDWVWMESVDMGTREVMTQD